MTDNYEEILFVQSNVDNLIQRHKDTLDAACQVDDSTEYEENVLRTQGPEGIGDALDHLRKVADIVEDAVEMHSKLCKEFDEKFAPDEILQAEAAKCNDCKEERQTDFEFRIRKAIGQVHLVSGEAAYATLEACRQEIEDIRS